MKRRVISLALAFVLALTLTPAAFAVGTFADVTDATTAQNVEVLRLMGVIEGDGNGSFRPNSSLTRAEFCKMAVVLQGRGEQVVRYASRTIFPDVRVSHWAAGYINLATTPENDKTPGLLHGYPDGTFWPDKTISGAEAAAVLLRALGYTDADTGGIWPDGYLQLAREKDVTKGLSISNTEITRAQVAQMFVNALTAKNASGKTLLENLGYTVALEEDPVTLYSVDLVNGELRTSAGSVKLTKPMESTVLNGLKGYVVKRDGKAVTFLPAQNTQGSAVTDAAVIVSADGSSAGLDALTGGSKNYTVYRNGVRSSVSTLKKYDVVTYNAGSNTLHACDTRVAAYYESCDPSPSAPVTIKTLGGTTFSVLPTAQTSLARFKPGQQFVLQLTADGQVAGAVENNTSGAKSNAFGFVKSDGKAYLICGGTLCELKCAGVGCEGAAVSISQDDKGKVYLSKQSSNAAGILDLTSRTLGGRRIASDVLVFSEGTQTSLASLGTTRYVDPNRIAYARVNASGEVDMLVIADTTGYIYYGRAKVENIYEETGGTQGLAGRNVKIDGNGHDITTAIRTGHIVNTGDFVEARVNSGKAEFTSFTILTKLSGVSASSWIGNTAVNCAGQTYYVDPDTVLCWNADSETWLQATASAETVVDAAKAYGGKMDLYVKDGVVRVIALHA